jgi:phage baseplate assembly protein gpV
MTTSSKKTSKEKSNLKQSVKTTRVSTQAMIKSGVVIKDGVEGVPTETGNKITPTTASPLMDVSLVRFKPETAGKWYGVYPALVTDIKDPDAQGRVKIVLPGLAGQSINEDPKRGGYWARLATLMAGNNRGSWFIPDVDDEVLVAFEGGDPSHPYVIGALWNGRDRPPESMDGYGNNRRKILQSRNGVKITFDDTDGMESLKLETPAGQIITLKDGSNSVKIEDSNGNRIEFDLIGINLVVSDKLTISAPHVEISAGGVSVNTGKAEFSGEIKCKKLVTDSVVSSSYTPGAGNIT